MSFKNNASDMIEIVHHVSLRTVCFMVCKGFDGQYFTCRILFKFMPYSLHIIHKIIKFGVQKASLGSQKMYMDNIRKK
eukprot:c30416_g1_i1 orf=1-231(-)